MDTDSFMVYIKIEDIYSDIAKDVETRFDTSNYESDRPLPKGKKNERGIKLMKDELNAKIMTEFDALRPKTHSYLTDDIDEDKKRKTQKSAS